MPGEYKQAEPLIIKLSGNFFEMGMQYANIYGNQILEQINIIKEDMALTDPKVQEAYQQKVSFIVDKLKEQYPNKVKEILMGMAHSDFAKQNQLTYEDFVKLDLAVFLSMINPNIVPPEFLKPVQTSSSQPEHCSYFAIADQNSHESGMGRNFDWPIKALHCLNANPVIVEMNPIGVPGFEQTVTFVGYMGQVSPFTMFNSKGLEWSLNSASLAMQVAVPGGMIMDRPYYMANALEQMFQVENFESLVSFVEHCPGTYPSIIDLKGPGNGDMASVEVCPVDPKKPGGYINMTRRLGSNNTTPQDAVEPIGYAQTNLLHIKEWQEKLGHPVNQVKQIGPYASHAQERYENLRNLVHRGPKEKSTMKTLLNYLARRLDSKDELPGATKAIPMEPPFNKDFVTTHYQVAYVPRRKVKAGEEQVGKIKVRFQQADSQDPKQAKMTEWKKFGIRAR